MGNSGVTRGRLGGNRSVTLVLGRRKSVVRGSMVVTSVRLPDGLLQLLKAVSRGSGRRVSDVIREALALYVSGRCVGDES